MTENSPLLPGSAQHSTTHKRTLFTPLRIATALTALLLTAWLVLPTSAPKDLASAITRKRLAHHLEAFSELAGKHNGSRSVGASGYLASVDYVLGQLKKTDYDVTVQTFTFPFFEKYAPGRLEFAGGVEGSLVSGRDFEPLRGSGEGAVENAEVQAVVSGCELTDFAEFTKGNVALVSREAVAPSTPADSPCSYRQKLKNAALSGASAIFLYTALPTVGTETPSGGGTPVEAKNLPVFGITHTVALYILQNLATDKHVTVSLESNVRYVNLETVNILAETKRGDPNNVIVAGSHLDSVPAGPGINDDASGSSATLEVALALHRTGLSKKVVNKVRFAWWSAEELGLIGSNYYVDNLNATDAGELERIALNLNNDMIASPNGVRFVYNGREAADEKLRGPSGVIQGIFEGYFDGKKLAHEPTEFDGRSDYGGFLRYGIPAGGLFTGAEVIKTEEQQRKFGGVAGDAFDPCYHLKCDTLENVQGLGMDLFVDLAGAMGHIVHKLAYVEDLRGFLGGKK
ncbi:hypothetical protein HDU98_003771 [Podochytrium sp. JEL0797]|nr:hypothetical protein HDU98_003771 [Podochytrium sp. JEL0797]